MQKISSPLNGKNIFPPKMAMMKKFASFPHEMDAPDFLSYLINYYAQARPLEYSTAYRPTIGGPAIPSNV